MQTRDERLTHAIEAAIDELADAADAERAAEMRDGIVRVGAMLSMRLRMEREAAEPEPTP